MIKRFNENRTPLTFVSANSKEKIQIINSKKWDVMIQIEDILEFMEEATLSLESQSSYLSQVLPVISLLFKRFSNPLNEQETFEVEGFRKSLLNSLKSRFKGYEENNLYGISMILDPRYKLFGFNNKMNEKNMIETLKILISDNSLTEKASEMRASYLISQEKGDKKKLRSLFSELEETEMTVDLNKNDAYIVKIKIFLIL